MNLEVANKNVNNELENDINYAYLKGVDENIIKVYDDELGYYVYMTEEELNKKIDELIEAVEMSYRCEGALLQYLKKRNNKYYDTMDLQEDLWKVKVKIDQIKQKEDEEKETEIFE